MDKNIQFLARTLLAYMAGVLIGLSVFLSVACMATGCCTTEERAAAIQAAKEIAQEVSEVVAQAKAAQETAAVQAQAAEPESRPEAHEPGQAAEPETPAAETDAAISANDRQEAQGADETDFAQLDWAYGGFSGKNASPVSGCEIGSLKVSSSGMSYKWVKGGCEQLGASSRTAADCICALFVKGKDGQWRGGKFDWISTSRTTRSFENIAEAGYNGWPKSSIETATAYAFCIVSGDGRKRSNVIVSAK